MKQLKMGLVAACLCSALAFAEGTKPEVHCWEGANAQAEGAYSLYVYKMIPLSGGKSDLVTIDLHQVINGKEKTVAALIANRQHVLTTGDVGVRYSKGSMVDLYISFTNVPTFPAPPNIGTLSVHTRAIDFSNKMLSCELNDLPPAGR